MFNDYYAHQKLREFELAFLERKSLALLDAPFPRRRGLAAPVARAVGRSIRRLGEAIELWAFFTERDHAMRAYARRS